MGLHRYGTVVNDGEGIMGERVWRGGRGGGLVYMGGACTYDRTGVVAITTN